jgi:hypothetical protein
MKKKLSPAKSSLPKFKSDKDAAEYFERHSVAGIWDQLPLARPATPSAALTRAVRERRDRRGDPDAYSTLG